MIARRSIVGWLLPALLVGCSSDHSPAEQSARVLFFGNSVTYVGNLPAVLTALCSAAGTRCSTEMIAQGGATLTARVADGSLDRAIASSRFDYLVLQERGGDVMGAAMNEPEAQGEVVVRAPIYRVSSGLSADAFASAQPVLAGTPSETTYDAATVRAVLELADRPCE